MNRKIFGVFAILAVAALAAPQADAACSPGKTFGSWDFSDGIYYYVYNFSGEFTTAVGAFWQPGARSLNNEGTTVISRWLRDYGGGTWYVSGNLGDSTVVGCPTGQMALMATEVNAAGESTFFLGSENEDLTKQANYNYGDLTFVPVPRARALASSRIATDVVLDLAIADVAAGYSSRTGVPITESVTAFNLYTAVSDTDPGRDVAAWGTPDVIPYTGGETSLPGYTVDCSGLQRTWLAVGIQATGEYDSPVVSLGTAVECDPGLADPDDKFQIIKGKGKGQKKGKPFKE